MKKVLSVMMLIILAMLSFVSCNKKESSTNVASGEWKPTAPVNVICGFAAGGGMDTLARAVAQFIDLDGQTMFITNIEGGGGNIGGMEAYHSVNDGSVLYIGSPQANACNYLSGGLSKNLNEEMVYIACLAEDVNILTVAKDSPYNTLEDFISDCKANPKKVTLATVGSGNSMEASAVDFFNKANIEVIYVPYDSASKSRTAVLGGHESALWSQLAEAKSYIDSGELKALAVDSSNRVVFYPNIPTFQEKGYGIEYAISRSFMLPPGADEAIARYYDRKLKAVFDNPEFKAIVQDKLGYVLEYTNYDGMKEKSKTVGDWAKQIMPLVLGK